MQYRQMLATKAHNIQGNLTTKILYQKDFKQNKDQKS